MAFFSYWFVSGLNDYVVPGATLSPTATRHLINRKGPTLQKALPGHLMAQLLDRQSRVVSSESLIAKSTTSLRLILIFPNRLKALMASLTCAGESSNTAVPARALSSAVNPHWTFALADHRKSISWPYLRVRKCISTFLPPVNRLPRSNTLIFRSYVDQR